MSKTTEPDAGNEGVIESVSGPVVTATDLDAQMNDVVRVGDAELMGEVIEIEGNLTTIQVYEETSGIAPAEPVVTTGAPLSVDLGPGMLDAIYDGVQRPLRELQEQMEGAFLERGVDAPGIDMDRTWEFSPEVEPGDEVGPTDIVGVVPETQSIDHKVMVPPDSEGGTVTDTRAGEFTVEETVVELDTGEEIQMHQEWPVRTQRPAEEKETPTTPLISGQRVLDGLFPIAKGGTAAIPGPFGSGKCVTPDTPVMLSDGELVEIEALFDRLAGERAAEDGEVLAEADAELMSFDEESGDIRPAPISHVYRGSTERLVRVTTASGRELEVTPAHKLFRMSGDLQVEETPAADLEVGDSLVMPRQVDVDVSRTTVDPYELLPKARTVEDSVVEPIRTAVEETSRPKQALAEAVGVSHDVLMNYTLGQTNPPLWVVDELCAEFDLDRPAIERVEADSNGKPVTVPAGVDGSPSYSGWCSATARSPRGPYSSTAPTRRCASGSPVSRQRCSASTPRSTAPSRRSRSGARSSRRCSPRSASLKQTNRSRVPCPRRSCRGPTRSRPRSSGGTTSAAAPSRTGPPRYARRARRWRPG